MLSVVQLPINPKDPEWAMVMADYDIVTRADLNDIFAACPQGVAFTVIADAAASHALLPFPVANGADTKVRATPCIPFIAFVQLRWHDFNNIR